MSANPSRWSRRACPSVLRRGPGREAANRASIVAPAADRQVEALAGGPRASAGRVRSAFLIAALLALCGAPALAAPDPCADWILLLQPTPPGSADLRLRLEHRAPPPAGGAWSFYGLVLPDPGTLPVDPPNPIRLAAAAPPPRSLEPLRLDGYSKPVYSVAGWYNRDVFLVIYFIRLPAPEPRLERLGLAVQAQYPGPPRPGLELKFHGLLPPKVLPLEPARAPGSASESLVCRVRSGVE